MKPITMILAFALALSAQDLTPEQKTKLDAVKKKVDEIAVRLNGGTFQFVGGQMFNDKPVKGQPYSAEAVNETTQVLADGNHIVNRTSSMLYRDSEGRERHEESIAKLGPWNADGAPAKAVFISDPVAKVSYTLQERSHTATKMPMLVTAGGGRGGKQVFSYSRTETTVGSGTGIGIGVGEDHIVKYEASASTEAAPKIEKLGSQSIEGVIADGTRTTITIPAGKIGNERDINIVDERWYSPELQVTVMSKHSDPRMGETTYKLTNISRAEPERSLFEVPPDYTISDQSEIRVRKFDAKEENQ